MKKVDDRFLFAYIDGELSVSEVEELENQLSKEELEQLVNEKKMERGLGDKLNSAPGCSADLWNKINGEIASEANTQKSSYSKKWFYGTFAIAAAITLFFSVEWIKYPSWVPQSVAELADQSQVKVDKALINDFISLHGVPVKIGDFPDTHHGRKISLVGAAIEKVAGDDVVSIYFNCCGEPGKIYLVPENGESAVFLQNEKKKSHGSAMKLATKGKYKAVYVSTHKDAGVLASLTTEI
ncbi:MAG: hypothetical protein NE330_05645 [Lentisphaeraceae bacterium]|nr:hypothetical protein [Lentisphaeraceae bacterium]